MRKFLQRHYHYFVSYSHKDSAFANDLQRWLSVTAGLRVWFDQAEFDSGERVHQGLANAIGQCQGVIFLLSKHSLASKFVQDEMEQALTEKKEHGCFQIILLRLDDCDVAAQGKAMRTHNWHNLATPAGPQLSLRAAVEILARVHAYDGWQRRQGDLKEVYVSRGWRENEEAFADEICRRLADGGLRLVGDLPNQRNTDPHRVARIMEGCWGHALVLPIRPAVAGSAAYKHFQQERDLSASLGLPGVVIAEKQTDLPPALAEHALLVGPEDWQDKDAADSVLRDRLYDFVESLAAPKRQVHAFFSSEYQHNQERNTLARLLVEITGTLPCYWGMDYRDMNIQGAIKQAICAASFVLADLTSSVESSGDPAHSSRTNVNVCVEAGIAWGADVRVLCLAAVNRAVGADRPEGRTRHVPFMFRNTQIDLYDDTAPGLAAGVEFLGTVHKVVLDDRQKYGRRVINYELGV